MEGLELRFMQLYGLKMEKINVVHSWVLGHFSPKKVTINVVWLFDFFKKKKLFQFQRIVSFAYLKKIKIKE
jgi:hypothetical protein